MVTNILLSLAAQAHAHGGPDGGAHHLMGQLFELLPFAMAAFGLAWAKLRR
jgi:hypothetical protein